MPRGRGPGHGGPRAHGGGARGGAQMPALHLTDLPLPELEQDFGKITTAQTGRILVLGAPAPAALHLQTRGAWHAPPPKGLKKKNRGCFFSQTIHVFQTFGGALSLGIRLCSPGTAIKSSSDTNQNVRKNVFFLGKNDPPVGGIFCKKLIFCQSFHLGRWRRRQATSI